MTVTRWWWIRHAPVTEGHGEIYGQRDLDADCSDRDAFGWLAGTLPKDAVWVTSHLRRTHQTADAIGSAGCPQPAPLREPAFAEQHFGEWQTRRWEHLQASIDPATWHKFWVAPAAVRPPGGESFEDVRARVAEAVDRLTLAHAGRDIVVVAHAGTIRAKMAHALELPTDRALGFTIDNLSVTRLDHVIGPGIGGDWRVVWVNHPPRRS